MLLGLRAASRSAVARAACGKFGVPVPGAPVVGGSGGVWCALCHWWEWCVVHMRGLTAPSARCTRTRLSHLTRACHPPGRSVRQPRGAPSAARSHLRQPAALAGVHEPRGAAQGPPACAGARSGRGFPRVGDMRMLIGILTPAVSSRVVFRKHPTHRSSLLPPQRPTALSIRGVQMIRARTPHHRTCA
jgi:hypothetical protein